MTTTNMVPILGSNRPPRPDAKLVRKSDPRERISVSVYARKNPHPPRGALAALSKLYHTLPAKRRYLTDRQFEAVYGAAPADLKKIQKWAQACGFNVLDSDLRMRRILVEGTIAQFNAAFHLQLNEYQTHEGISHRGREGEICVPKELHRIVEGVFGLDTRRVGRPRLRRARHASAAKPLRRAFFPPEVAQLYDFPAGLDGSGQNIAVLAFNGAPEGDPSGGYRRKALRKYFKHFIGGRMPAIQDVVVQGRGNRPGADTARSSDNGDATDEIMLDMCVVGSVAPGAKMFMYFTESTSQGWIDALREAITDKNDISVISISYGDTEDAPHGEFTKMSLQIVNDTLESAIARGITICTPAGDDGSSDGSHPGAHVDFPASSPFTLAVGGTRLVATRGANPAIAKETVWQASGGGISAKFRKPSYQNRVRVPRSVNPGHKIGRGVPDVAAVGDPNTGVKRMRASGKTLQTLGGTSVSAPLWASLIARINQGIGARCGFINPLLYRRFARGVLRDITKGNNGAYSARHGWDACTGLGYPHEAQLLQALSGQRVG
jgi:kumamolisin